MIKRLADRLLRWYCHPDYYRDISGDLEEIYDRSYADMPAIKSDLLHMARVIMLFRPSLLREFALHTFINDTGMLRNYFKISLRNLNKHRAYTFINVFGLAIGLGAFLLINQYIKFEKSYDDFIENSDQLYRLTTDQVVDGVMGTRDAMSFNPSGKALMDELPEVINYTTTYKFNEITFKNGENLIAEKMVLGADSSFLKLFSYELISGDPNHQLIEPNTIVLTQAKAKKYFGSENPVGKELYLYSGFNKSFKVTGVMQDVPENTHYHFDALISLSTIKDFLTQEAWNGYNYYTYVQLAPDSDLEKINGLLPGLARKFIGEESSLVFNLQPVQDIHLHSVQTYEPEAHGDAKSVKVLVIISIFILIIAWVNYINLATARAVDRAKEVGLRKVIGAKKGQLVTQFLMEALIINFFGCLIAFGLAEFILPYFNNLIGREMATHLWNDSYFIGRLFLFFLLGVIISGFYPAVVLSSFKPVTVLKGKFRNSKSGALLRKSLVVTQFAASFILLTGTFAVYKQVQHMRSKDLGLNVDKVIGFANPRLESGGDRDAFLQKKLSFLNELRTNHNIENVARISNIPGGGASDVNSNGSGARIMGMTDFLDGTTYVQSLDENTVDVLDMKILHGRTFIKGMKSDSSAAIVNEAFLKRHGLEVNESILGNKILFGKELSNNRYPIIGIVKDVYRGTLKNAIEPTIYFNWTHPGNTVVKLSGENIEEGLNHVKKTWSQFFPTEALNYNFVDERYDQLYLADKRFGNVFVAFSIFAILVASLGLFGLASFIAMQRTKEVGVRKVLGASVAQIIGIFYKDFLILIIVSVVLGVPLVYLGVDSWLNGYAYRILFPWESLPLSAIALMIFAFAIVGYQIYRVAILSPASTLKDE
ncbi:MAG: ABC transporter permease [Cyclobacteriaceae bacterium]